MRGPSEDPLSAELGFADFSGSYGDGDDLNAHFCLPFTSTRMF